MAKAGKDVKVVSVGGAGTRAGLAGAFGVAAGLVLFIVNALTVYLILSSILSIVGLVQTIGFSDPFNLIGQALGIVSASTSSVSFTFYLDIMAFIFMGIALILLWMKIKESGGSAFMAALGAFFFAGIAFYVRFMLLPPIMLSFDQMAMAGSPMNIIIFGSIVLGLFGFTTVFLIQGIAFFIFGLFTRKTLNKINNTYGKIARGGRLILTVSIMNLISMVALFIAVPLLQGAITTLISGLGGGGGGIPDISSLLVPLILFGVGVFLKMITIPILTMFAFLSLAFGFRGIAKGA
jgi:hypothetical protein